MKSDPSTAMQQLIEQVRMAIPFDTPTSTLCSGICTGCSKKLLDFLDMELEDWQERLDRGDQPLLGDIQKLARRSKKIYKVLQRNGLVEG